MGQRRRVWSLSVRLVVAIAAVVLLLGSVTSVTRLASTVLGPEHIEMPEAGFAISLPREWQHERVTVYDEDWWDPAKGAPTEQHQEFLERGGVLLARRPARTEAGHEQCQVYGWSGNDAQAYVNQVDDEPRVAMLEHRRMELPGGSAVAYDLMRDDGGHWRDYLVTDGERWLMLGCGSRNPPGDHWLSIAETLEFLPVEASPDW